MTKKEKIARSENKSRKTMPHEKVAAALGKISNNFSKHLESTVPKAKGWKLASFTLSKDPKKRVRGCHIVDGQVVCD
jgi:hypothetical protein